MSNSLYNLGQSEIDCKLDRGRTFLMSNSLYDVGQSEIDYSSHRGSYQKAWWGSILNYHCGMRKLPTK